jgi:hypothetical protein
MARTVINLFEDRITGSDEASQLVEDVATSIVKAANKNTTAPAGFVWKRQDARTIRVTSRGAAAVPREFGTRMKAAGRPMKRSLDMHEVG